MREKRDSVTRNATTATAPDPLRQVKLELGIALLLAVVVWLLVGRWFSGLWQQVSALALYGVGAMVWLVFRTRRVVARVMRGDG